METRETEGDTETGGRGDAVKAELEDTVMSRLLLGIGFFLRVTVSPRPRVSPFARHRYRWQPGSALPNAASLRSSILRSEDRSER